MTDLIPSASVFDQQLYDHIRAHGSGEAETLVAYEELAQTTESKAFAYLAGLILEDERRHHRLLADLAETIRTSAELSGKPTPIPYLDFHKDREAILKATRAFLKVERDDNRELKRLANEMKALKDTTAWTLILRIMQHDNAKHRLILRFIRDRARDPVF